MNKNTCLFFFSPHQVNAPVPPRRWLLEFLLHIFTDILVFPRSVERSLEGEGRNMVLVFAIMLYSLCVLELVPLICVC